MADGDLLDGLMDLLDTIVPRDAQVVAGELNPEPDVGVAAVLSASSDDSWNPVGVRTVQLRLRGDEDYRTVNTLADSIFQQLHGLSAVRMGSIVVAELTRMSYTSLGRDERGRWERSDNYLARVAYETPAPMAG